jgi:hypothetical protein
MMTPATPFIPDPRDWPGLHAAIEQARGRRVLLVPVGLPAHHQSVWIAVGDADFIIYPRDASPARQLREVTRQAAHVLLGHVPVAGDPRLLFPRLDPAMVATIVTVFRYSEADEAEAAEFASRADAGYQAGAENQGLDDTAGHSPTRHDT